MTPAAAMRPLRRDRVATAPDLRVPCAEVVERSRFDHHCHRSQQEEIAAMNARTDTAAAAHRALGRLHAGRAVAILLGREEVLH
jgi:hypothetical protein